LLLLCCCWSLSLPELVRCPLGWAWEWLTSLLAEDLGSVVGGGEPTGGEGSNAIDGGAFIDPNGNS
jgi:hypothetical protein